MRLLTELDIEHLAVGSAVLGTGGGGDPYLGMLAARRSIAKNGPIPLVEADELPPDTLVLSPFGIGSPVPFLERLTLVDELIHSVEALETYLGRKAGAIMSMEIGGMNSVVPIAVASELGLPIIDADGMGRAFPQIQLVTFTMHGIAASPIALGDEHGNVVIINAIDNFWVETFARSTAVEMGAICGGVGFPMTAGDVVASGVLGSVSYAQRIGRGIRDAQANHRDPIQAAVDETNGYRIFTGRIIDVQRRVERGWALGETIIAGIDDDAGRQVTIQFQNEHLVVLEGEDALVTVPDLIAILDSERGDPITTENLRYGFRVTVIGIPSDPQWRTPEGLALAAPDHWGYSVPFVPVETRFGGRA